MCSSQPQEKLCKTWSSSFLPLGLYVVTFPAGPQLAPWHPAFLASGTQGTVSAGVFAGPKVHLPHLEHFNFPSCYPLPSLLNFEENISLTYFLSSVEFSCLLLSSSVHHPICCNPEATPGSQDLAGSSTLD